MLIFVFAILVVWFLIFQNQIENFLGFYKKKSNVFLIVSFLIFVLFASNAYLKNQKIYVLIYEIFVLFLIIVQLFLLKNYILHIQQVEKLSFIEKLIWFFSYFIFFVLNIWFLNLFFLIKNFRKFLWL